MIKKLPEIETLTNLLWVSFGITGGLSYFINEDYWTCAVFLLVGVLYAYKLFKSQWEKYGSRGK